MDTRAAAPYRSAPGAPKFVFEVDDLPAARAHLREHDVELADDVRTPAPGVRVLDGRDPEGNKFSIETREPA